MVTFNKKRINEEQFEKYIIDDASINLAKEIYMALSSPDFCYRFIY